MISEWLVYNATSSGLSDAIWALRFSLPMVESHLRSVDQDTYLADNNIGKIFLNFMLDVEKDLSQELISHPCSLRRCSLV